MTKKIAIEEHFIPNEGMDFGFLPQKLLDRLRPSMDKRIVDMDAAGIDQVVLSSTLPITTIEPKDVEVSRAQMINDQEYQMIQQHPDRFAGFAYLPMLYPDEAVKELERVVKNYDFKGVMISGNVAGKFLDDKMFEPLLKKAAELDVPIYLHPGLTPKPVMDAYYSGFDSNINTMLGGGAYGWHYEVSMHILRMVIGGIFDRIPNLKMIIGHLGEGLAFHMDRIDEEMNPLVADKIQHGVSYYLKHNIYITTSGYPYDGPFYLAKTQFGADHTIFAVDYPFTENKLVSDWFDQLKLTETEREQIANKNVTQILHL